MDHIRPGPLSGPSNVLWIGGAQWAGKSSAARILADRYGLQEYDYDYHDSRGHTRRAERHPERYPVRHRAALESADARWVDRTPEQMAAEDQAIFVERFEMTLEDISGLPPEPPVVASGWGFRPALVAPLLDSQRRAIFLVPTEEFRDHQLRTMPRAGAVSFRCSDPELAQRNRVARDRLLALDVVATARELGLRTVMVDGTLTVDEVVALVEEHFRPFLPDPRPSLEEHRRRLEEHLRRGDHEAAVRAALETCARFPDSAHLTWFGVATALAAAGRADAALATVEDAVTRDLTWRLALFESPAFEPIRAHRRFGAVLALARRRLEAVDSRPEVQVWSPEAAAGPPPLLLFLHGANASADQFAELAPGLASAGWLVACGQSSQPTAPGRFCWDDRACADAEVDVFLERAGDHDAGRVGVVGFSQGAAVAVRAALRGRAPAGFLGLAPGFSPADRRDIERLAASAAPVRGGLCTGERDRWLEGAREVHAALVRAGHHVWFETLPGRGHALSPEMRALTPEIVGRWLGGQRP